MSGRSPFPESGPTKAQFRWFADNLVDDVPLYAELAAGVAADAELVGLASPRLPGQPAPNLLFGAVRYLLARSEGFPELRARFETGSGSGDPETWRRFRQFCFENRVAVAEIVATHRTQTNEVGRAIGLLPLLASVRARIAHPIHLIEIGTSAGLLLRLDHFRYRYEAGAEWGPGDSPVLLTTELRGAIPPLPGDGLGIERRIGIDLNPIDLADQESIDWLEALIWPGHPERVRRLRGAIDVARSVPADVITGDALVEVESVIARVPSEVVPVVFHSFALIQWTPEQRAQLDRLFLAAGRRLLRLWLEWFSADGEPAPRLRWFEYHEGRLERHEAGAMHYHGNWLDWRASA